MTRQPLDLSTLPDYADRLAAARRRAKWSLGYPGWADQILRAFARPDEEEVQLDAELAQYDSPSPARSASGPDRPPHTRAAGEGTRPRP